MATPTPQEPGVAAAPPQELVDMFYTAGLTQALYQDPKTRKGLLKLIKEKAPEVRIPELDTETEVREALKPDLEKVTKLEERLAQTEAKLREREERDELVVAGLVSRDELPEVEKVMTEKGITNRRTAAEHYAMSKRLAAPRRVPTPIQLPNYEGLFKNPTQWARQEAMKVLAEMGR